MSAPRVMVVRRANRPSGGDLYEEMVLWALRPHFETLDHSISVDRRGVGRYLDAVNKAVALRRRVPRETLDALVLCKDAAIIRPVSAAKRVVIIHHMELSPHPFLWAYAALDGRLDRVLREADAVVVVAQF